MRTLLPLALLFLAPCAHGQEAPFDAPARYEAARAQLALGNAGLALEGFRKMLRQNPRSLPALNGLAIAYDRLQLFDVSRACYEHALGLNPEAPVTLNNFATSLLLQGRLAEAQPLLERAATAADSAVRAQAQANLAWLHAARAAETSPENRPQTPARTHSGNRISRLGPSTQVLLTSHPAQAQRR